MSKNCSEIEARGRNGWFRAASIDVFMLGELLEDPPKVCVSVYSRQKGEFPPIYFKGPREGMARVFSDLLEAIKKIELGDGSIEIKIQEGRL
ncbi:MAG: hypothetical protein H6Q43_1207 [Deltaproteobacteria bacterium]|nr:hypothetical protein [Deltaproteobacteria bacterium]MBP1717769.1 hypothetical protein [Deltaproteobacteria bacterium]